MSPVISAHVRSAAWTRQADPALFVVHKVDRRSYHSENLPLPPLLRGSVSENGLQPRTEWEALASPSAMIASSILSLTRTREQQLGTTQCTQGLDEVPLSSVDQSHLEARAAKNSRLGSGFALRRCEWKERESRKSRNIGPMTRWDPRLPWS